MDFHTDQVDGNSLLKVDVVDIAGSAVATSSAQLGVNLVNVAGSALSNSCIRHGAGGCQGYCRVGRQHFVGSSSASMW